MSGSQSSPDVFDMRKVRKLIELMKEHDLTEIDLKQADSAVRIKRGGEVVSYSAPVAPPPAAPAAAPAPAPAFAPAPTPATATAVEAAGTTTLSCAVESSRRRLSAAAAGCPVVEEASIRRRGCNGGCKSTLNCASSRLANCT